MDLGDKHQTTPREATNDPGNDNINALKNAHLTPRAIKAIQKGVDIKNEDSTEDSTTDGRKRQKAAPPVKKNRASVSTPKPKPKSNVSTKVQVKSGTPSKAPTKTSKAPNKPAKSIPTKPNSKPAVKASGGDATGYVTLLDMINAGAITK
jgi:outer membrane biosynthesis protein TonB